MPALSTRRFSALLGSLLLPGSLVAQAAVDPSVAPRAAAMERHGSRVEATERLGRYLATAPDDGAPPNSGYMPYAAKRPISRK